MRLKLLAVTAAVLVATTSALFEVQTEDVVPYLTQIPGVAELLGIPELLGLPGLLEVVPATLISPETSWGKFRAGLAGTGVAIIEIAVFIGYIFNYLDKIETVNLNIRKEEAEAAAEAAKKAAEAAEAEAEEGAEGGERYNIVPSHSPQLSPSVALPPNIRRVAQQPPYRYQSNAPYPHPQPRPRPQYSSTHSKLRPYRKSYQKRSVVPSRASTADEGVLGRVVRAGKQIMWILKHFFLMEVPKEDVAKDIKQVVDELTEDLMRQVDADGCLQKLVCHLQEKPKDTLTPEEEMLLLFFPVVQSHAACTDTHFPRCLLSAPELDRLLTERPMATSNLIP